MENYIVINGNRIDLTEDQVELILATHKKAEPQIRLSEVAVGETFQIGQYGLIVLEHSGDTTAVILKDLLLKSRFGDTNNYNESEVDENCLEFAQELAVIIGLDNIIPHQVDLTSNDGLKDYGTIERRAALLTADQYRRYIDILDNFKPDDWWWLATPFSTASHDSDSWVLCVSPSGYFNFDHFNFGNGVRPFLILKSNIFVSK